ncbi:hypothetical protein PBAL39_05358 [Pedobacter sp. BAL39]|uniref:hypothetical protein n=1 Tax=Pedobacter sp. BAL39 TaxID=391596 RepID=UPI0001559804|nr:hypothetical protein [Pedobacter sp. BAL39]EDM37200.1 hypothetical protein PBAL39_05358 [Pedobacter sp. BAL39]
MKRNLLIVFLVLIHIAVFAQRDADYNYSIGVRGYSLMQLPKVMNETNSSKTTSTYFNGGVFKFNDNQISYRISGSYLKASKRFFNDCSTCAEINGDVTDYFFKVGFEKSLNFSRIQPYIGLDLGYRFNKYEGISRNINTMRADAGMSTAPRDVKATKSGLLVSPLLGIKINPISILSVFAEVNLDYFYSYERQDAVTQDLENTRTLTKTHQSEYLINPVSVGILLHLGSNK